MTPEHLMFTHCVFTALSTPRAEQLAAEFPEVDVDIRLMDQLDASIADCDTIFAGALLRFVP